jgi:hypothetical protein
MDIPMIILRYPSDFARPGAPPEAMQLTALPEQLFPMSLKWTDASGSAQPLGSEGMVGS